MAKTSAKVSCADEKIPLKSFAADDISVEKRESLESVLQHRFFYVPSFEIYGGVSGLYDYGPPGCALMSNIINEWRKQFILRDGILEIQCSEVTPEAVLKASGHVDRFLDYMVKEEKGNEIYRADHLIKQVLGARLELNKSLDNVKSHYKNKTGPLWDKVEYPLSEGVVEKYNNIIETLDGCTKDDLQSVIEENDIRPLNSGLKVGEPCDFNLMFGTWIGPTSNNKAYLRPETAQAQFMNFKRLYEYNNHELPFGSAIVGKSFRNEISPRQGIIRLREFTMGEIEYFVDTEDYSHKNFWKVSNVRLPLLTSEAQIKNSSKIQYIQVDKAVEEKIIHNQTLGYYLAKIYLFLLSIGINSEHIRVRQHMPKEMAHYASDCWDAEILSSYGWIECVGCADRSAYDLSVHSKITGENLSAREALHTPIIEERLEIAGLMPKLGKNFGGKTKFIVQSLDNLNNKSDESQKMLGYLQTTLESQGYIKITGTDSKDYTLDKDLISIKKIKSTTYVREFIPNVIEPSFGFDRIFYKVLEHAYYLRENEEKRAVFKFPVSIAPYKVVVFPLSKNETLRKTASEIHDILLDADIQTKIDDSGRSIGRRYARSDEIGVPYGITIDFQTQEDSKVTLRERDSMNQVRGNIKDVIEIVKRLVNSNIEWKDVLSDPSMLEVEGKS